MYRILNRKERGTMSLNRKAHPAYVIFLALMALMGLGGLALLIWGSRHPAVVTPLGMWLNLARWAVHG